LQDLWWGQCELGFQRECEPGFQAGWVMRFQEGKWVSVEKSNGGCSKGVRELKRLYSEAADINKKRFIFDEPTLLCEISINTKR
jgi:hypothetical protein